MNDVLEVLKDFDPESAEYREFVAEVLRRVDPTRPLGTELYKAVARSSWNVYWESVSLRFNDDSGKVEVFMIKRDDSDPDWSGYWHVPGTALRPSDDENTPKFRLSREYGVPVSIVRVGDAGFGWYKIGDEGRGAGISFVFLTDLERAPEVSDTRGWFPVDDLPDPTVPAHVERIIPLAVTKFRARHNL
ncbi:MAG: hypothetical protein WCT11_02105 [Candidatus Magasanikbacteria bacterium]